MLASPDSKPQRFLRSFTIHAESLQRDDVWSVVRQTLDRIEAARGGRVTLLVSTAGAISDGVDISPRLTELADRGHEIGQHSHYYAVSALPGARSQREDLSPGNVLKSLNTDYEYLSRAGIRPLGFVSGRWAIVDTIHEWLSAHDFAYDCSYRTYALPYDYPPARRGDDHLSPARRDGILILPTTGSIFTLPRPSWRHGRRGRGYALDYCHDYDFLDARKRAYVAALCVMLAASRRAFIPAMQVGSMFCADAPGTSG